ncbi:hypothetical protein QBC34DRAFT_93119 [Podospora aff. communis PSN243]|uniref:Homeobox domain-containing protein n=1 Tax=Podospora aff. communis PSN243 TaxID=3040156 RepID=A0AAV9GMS9_9PEZI|nr:hypothetical protein QBC34DRAFT_93119 [Podospora aff. communis PSN243]
MDMEYSADMYRPRAYSAVSMAQPFHGLQQHEQQGQQQYQYLNHHHHLMALYQHQRAALMLGQGGLHGSKQTEPKPRLAKDEVELLEREFAKNPKPNSSTKRELAEQMGVEVPRINNWFQNRRAKEKQMKKTAEFEAQQARQRGNSEPNSSDGQDVSANGDFRPNHRQQTGLSSAEFSGNDDSDEAESERHPSVFEESDAGAPNMAYSHPATASPASSDSDGFIHIEYDNSSTLHTAQMMPDLAHIATEPDMFAQEQRQSDFQTHVPFNLELHGPTVPEGLMPSFDITPAHACNPDTFSERNYYDMPSVAQFPSQLITEGLATSNNESPIQHQSPESFIKTENLSPCSMPASLPAPADMRFKSPPPPADIASRRNIRRPAPLGLSAIRGGTGPKTGIDAPRRSETASPMRRISSATGGLPGRVQKSFSGPRSPFLMDRAKEAIFQSLQSSHTQSVAPQNAAMSPVSPADANGHENTTIKTDEDQTFSYGSMGSFPVFKTDSNIKTPPDTPALATNFPEHFFASSAEQAWNFAPSDEPLPTPSLCSHGGSELEFSMAPQMPGYVASQPVTPSFPPSIGPTYNNGFFGGGNLANAEYTFPDSYPESSARSSPVGPPKSRQQFQFAQNVTPQDFSMEK